MSFETCRAGDIDDMDQYNASILQKQKAVVSYSASHAYMPIDMQAIGAADQKHRWNFPCCI